MLLHGILFSCNTSSWPVSGIYLVDDIKYLPPLTSTYSLYTLPGYHNFTSLNSSDLAAILFNPSSKLFPFPFTTSNYIIISHKEQLCCQFITYLSALDPWGLLRSVPNLFLTITFFLLHDCVVNFESSINN